MGNRTKLWVRGLKWLLIAVVAFYALPFIIYLVLPASRNYMYEQVLYKPLTDSLTEGRDTDEAKAMAIFKYVSTHCRQPQGKENPKYEFPHQVLQQKVAACDQQVWLLMHFLRVQNIHAQMVFLYGRDSVSHHTVAAVETQPGRYIMLDPFYKLYFINGVGKIASIGDITKGNIQYGITTIPDNYFNLYETKYPHKTHSNNKISGTKKILRALLFAECNVFGKLFSGVFEGVAN